ncbi:MAG TPA: PrsW family intramembrane metalloprotease [Firmicutes bacterium]|nr:PrsW family intramembrane metalloprotease [Bacillota bacterium]
MSDLLLAVLAALAPGLLWVWFFYRYDRFEPEPKRLIYRVFLYGMAGVPIAAVLESLVRPLLVRQPSLVGMFFAVLFGIGLVEEGVKLYVVYRGAYSHPEFDEVMDGIIYATTAGLGFASLETFLYIFRLGLGVAPARALLTTLAHASFAGLAGYYLGLAKLGPPERRRGRILRGLAVAAVLHAVYDFLILSRLSPLGAVLVVAFAYSALAARIREARRLSPFRTDEGDGE